MINNTPVEKTVRGQKLYQIVADAQVGLVALCFRQATVYNWIYITSLPLCCTQKPTHTHTHKTNPTKQKPQTDICHWKFLTPSLSSVSNKY